MVFIGSVTITSISGSATVHFGNTKTISPASSSSTTSGSGSGNTGALTFTYPEAASASSNSPSYEHCENTRKKLVLGKNI